jgi:uncharacterized paraquat-inducible protein A
MNATNQFMVIVRDTPVTDDTQAQPLANTFMRFCAVCMEIMPHYREATYCQCAVCETKAYKSEHGYIRRDMAIVLNWLVVVLIVLFVFLRDWKW